MDVYTVHVDYHNERAQCRTRIVKRRVLKTGCTLLTLSAEYAQGDAVRLPLSDCYSDLETARAALDGRVAAMVSLLNLRIGELKEEPEVAESQACSEL